MAVTAASSRKGREYDTRVQRAVLASTRLLSVVIVVLGVTMIVVSLVRGGGPLALGVVLGTMLAAIGALRLWLARDAGPGRVRDGGER
jgi:hypothetical protein